MNASMRTMIQEPPGIWGHGIDVEKLKESGLEGSSEGNKASDLTHLAPLVGTVLAHNTTQSLLLGRAVTYFSNPVVNYFLNLPIAAAIGSIAYAIAKLGLGHTQKEKASTDLEAVTKSIGWSTVFTTIGAIGLQKAIVESASADAVSRVVALAAGDILGAATVEVGFVLASTCLSLALISLASDMFKEESKKA